YKSNLLRVFKESNMGILFVQYTGLVDSFLLKGGFTQVESDLKSANKTSHEKERLQKENLVLQNDNLKYQESIRDKDDQIRNLQRDNLRLSNWDIRFRWLIAIITFIIGFIINYFIGK